MAKTQDEIDESPASVIATLPSGGKYDLNNIPGKLKRQLILEGEADINTFAGDGDNIPGAKRKLLIEAREAQKKSMYAEINKDIKNTFKVGDVVKYRDHISEVLEVSEDEGVKIRKSSGKVSKWIHHSLVEIQEAKE